MPRSVSAPETPRYRLLHTAARIVLGHRKRILKFRRPDRWATDLAAAFVLVFARTPT